MKEPARDIKNYRTDLSAALEDTFQRRALDKFAVDYRASRERIYSGLNDRELIAEVAARKDESVRHLDELFVQFKEEAEKRGVQVHLARDAADANRIIAKIAEENGCKMVVKSKSMSVEEIQTNTALEAKGMEVVETDLAEWIIQLRHEGPSHMVMPAIHLSRTQVADTFTKETGKHQTEDITSLVRVARRELRRKFAEADMGISGMNFAVAESGAIGLVTNEGNARMVTTLPRVHVAVGGIDKLIPSFDDAMATLRVLPRNATGQHLTSYVTWIAGGVPTASAPDGKKSMHVVFVDNGRKAVLNDPILSQALRCVRCGACANVCPVYRLVGGHRMGYIYIGAIGLILTYLFHGKDRAKALVQNCVNCQACKSVCAAGIDLPGLIEEIRMRYIEQDGNSLPMNLLASTLKNRKAFHTLLKFAKYAQKPLTGGEQFIRHLPSMFAKDNEFRALPAIADKAFRDRWEKLDRPVSANPSLRVAIFAGCVQDFVYPEQLEAAVKLMQGHNIRVDFPMDQSCCGLPVVMMGQRETARDVALQNMDAFEKGDYDVILTLCASCASQLKEGYVELFAGQPGRQARAKALADKVMDFSTFAKEKLGLSAESFNHSDEKVTYHASCHLCRGLGVKEAPRELIAAAADYVPAAEEEVCCGFGGTYSAKFPEVSAALLRKKLDGIADTGADRVVMDCPGCVLQIRGGAEKDGKGLKVTHISELLAENLKK